MVWAIALLATDVKQSIPYVHWVLSALAVVLILPYLLRVRWKTRFPARAPAWLLVFAVCLPAIYGAKMIYSFAEAAKLTVILLGAISIFVALSPLAHYAFRGFVVSVSINLLLLAGGFLGLGTAEIMFAGRWGTILSYPGSLWRVAVTVWVFAAYLSIKRRSVPYWGLLAGSTVLIYLDGARTAILLLLAGALYLVFVLANEAVQFKRALFVGGLGVGIVAVGVAYSGIISGRGGSEQGPGVGRVQQLTTSVAQQGIEGLDAADVIRFQMWKDVVEAIQAHPLLGTGIGTTTSETVVGPMVIHMTYLQVWADMGLLGLTAYVWLMWGWIVLAPTVLRRVRALSDPTLKALYYNSVFLLLVYGLAGCFHPLSTEWSEWIIFIVPYALFWEIARSEVVASRVTALPSST
jgi:O-antigen ligase